MANKYLVAIEDACSDSGAELKHLKPDILAQMAQAEALEKVANELSMVQHQLIELRGLVEIAKCLNQRL